MIQEAEIWTIARTGRGYRALLRPLGSETVVPVYLGQEEAQSILIGLGSMASPRPLLHDSFLEVLRRGGMELSRVEIYDMAGGLLHARLVLGEFCLEAVPSDALALAVRAGCPICLSGRVIALAGLPGEEFLKESFWERSGNRREELTRELDEVLEAEDYERAAEIRDALIILDSTQEGDD
ncbi:MAG: DUF151 domain-containing protein [Treponema sp.]|jgi:bifunctional DNase/RNase|nr:DUF151 domain-containing protein [Treponema sp.]